jgi:hypothetical protein
MEISMMNFKVGQLIQHKRSKKCFLILKVIETPKRIYGERLEVIQMDDNAIYKFYEAGFNMFEIIA